MGEPVEYIQGRTDKLQLKVLEQSDWGCWKRWETKQAKLVNGKLHIQDYKTKDEFASPIDLAKTQIKYGSSKGLMYLDQNATVYTFKVKRNEMSGVMKLVEGHRRYGQMLAKCKPYKDESDVMSNPSKEKHLPAQQMNNTDRTVETKIGEVSIPLNQSTSMQTGPSSTCTSSTSTSSEEWHSATLSGSSVELSEETEGVKNPNTNDQTESGEESGSQETISTAKTELQSIDSSTFTTGSNAIAVSASSNETDNTVAPNSIKKPKALKTRDKLPQKQIPVHPLTIKMLWDLLNGKSMHISYFEPLSLLQILCEQFEYCSYIEEALHDSNPVNRMARIAGFAVSGYASSEYRRRKPFNPRLAETYELDLWEEKGWRYVSEQVHHKPDVAAVHVEGRSGWSVSQTLEIVYHMISIAISGKLEAAPLTTVKLKLDKFNEVYEFNKVHTIIHHTLNAAQRCLSNSGVMHIKCNTGYSAKIIFEKGETNRKVHGNVTNPSGVEMLRLEGQWNSHLYALADAKPPMKCFSAEPLPASCKEYFGYTKFSMQLNILQEKDDGCLPLSDSRLRPDLQMLETGRIEEADSSKCKLERNARVTRAAGREPQPQWFKQISNAPNHRIWKFNHEYWKAKKNGFRNYNTPQLW